MRSIPVQEKRLKKQGKEPVTEKEDKDNHVIN